MKLKFFTIIFFLFLFLISTISAIEIDMKDSYDKGETMITKFSGNFLEPPSKENVKLYRNHVRVSFEPSIAKINGNYYLYASLLNKEEDNYSLIIENVQYYEGSEISNENLIRNFLITDKTADFSLNPGYVVTNKNFYLEVQNLKNSEISITIEPSSFDLFGPEEIDVASGEIKKIYFSIENLTQSTTDFIKLNTEDLQYEVLADIFITECISNCTGKECGDDGCGGSCGNCDEEYYCENGECIIEENCTSIGGVCQFFSCKSNSVDIGKLDCGLFQTCCKDYSKNESDEDYSENKSEEKNISFEFEPEKLNLTFSTNSNITRTVYIYNKGKKLENISLSISSSLEPYISLPKEKINEIEENSRIKINLSFFSNRTLKFLEGQISAKANDSYAYLSVYLNFIKDYIPTNGDSYYKTKTCSEKNGTICDEDEICEGKEEDARDGNCCLGECIKKQDSLTGKIIGWIIVVLIIGFLIWFYSKTKKKRM
jgi:hypothetical protein